ncbi:MAG TPA: YqaE/Pmp3 family membrane protein [Chitinophagaceae bacterium]
MRKGILLFASFIIIATSAPLPSFATEIVPSSNATSSTEPDPAAVKAALEEFKSLSRQERKERVKEVKKEMKELKKANRKGNKEEVDKALLIILAILLPPLAVYLHQGEINNKFWISLILTLLFWLPGVIYALVVILGED